MNEMIKNNEINVETYRNIFVMSDVHGCKTEFNNMLDKIDFDDKKDLLIILGDVIDRGIHSIELLHQIMNMRNVSLIKGNHEEMLFNTMISGSYAELKNWQDNGGYSTYKEYSKLSENEKLLILNTIRALPQYIKIKINQREFLLVHAGLHIFRDMSLDEMLKLQNDNLLWMRKSFLKSKVKHDFTVIFGHTRTFTIPFEIYKYPDYYKFYSEMYDESRIEDDIKHSKIWYNKELNKIGIDCGVSSGGKLACLKLNDMSEYYI